MDPERLALREIIPKLFMVEIARHARVPSAEVAVARPTARRDAAMRDLVRLLARQSAGDFVAGLDAGPIGVDCATREVG